MLTRGIPETPAEALEVIAQIADLTPNDPAPLHWPHSQVVALAQIVRAQSEMIIAQHELIETLEQRCDTLKDKIIEIKQELGMDADKDDEPIADGDAARKPTRTRRQKATA